MTGRGGDGPYLDLDRQAWRSLRASARLRETVGGFLGEQIRPAPFIVAVAGSVAVGKSTTARVLRTLITRWPQQPRTALVTTDNFLCPNAVLEQRGLISARASLSPTTGGRCCGSSSG